MRDTQRRDGARALRRNMTDAELCLWQRLRRRQLDGHRFRRQHPIGPFYADFACIERRLVVEIDGGQHTETVDEDAERTRFLEAQGFMVLRFWNHDVLLETHAVLEKIRQVISSRPPS